MSHPTPNSFYSQNTGLGTTNPFIEVFNSRDPGVTDTNYLVQQRWWNTAANTEWILVGFSTTGGTLVPDWRQISSSGTGIQTLNGNTGGFVPPTAGNINVVGDGTVITVAGTPGTSTLEIEITGVVPPANGGTGVSNPTGHGVAIGEGSAPFNFIPLTSGQVLIGSTGVDPVAATLTPGPGISITNGPGAITIAATGAGFMWQRISANQTLVKENGYICVSPGGTLLLALPAVSAIGDSIEVTLQGATGWTITQPNAGSQIHAGSQSTTVGVGGTLSSTAQGDTIELVCINTNADWQVISMIGNLTVI